MLAAARPARRTDRAAVPPAKVARRELRELVIDLDALIVVCHSEKDQAAPTFERTFGHDPKLTFCDNTGEFLAARLRRGNVGTNTSVDHLPVPDRTARSSRPTLLATAGFHSVVTCHPSRLGTLGGQAQLSSGCGSDVIAASASATSCTPART